MLLDDIARSLYNISKEKSSEQISLSCYSAIVLRTVCVKNKIINTYMRLK